MATQNISFFNYLDGNRINLKTTANVYVAFAACSALTLAWPSDARQRRSVAVRDP